MTAASTDGRMVRLDAEGNPLAPWEDAETKLLGALLEGQPILSAVVARLTPEDLGRPRHQRIFRAILAAAAAKEPPYTKIPPELVRYATELMDGVPALPPEHVTHYLDAVLEEARRRGLKAAADNLTKLSANGADEAAVRAALADAAEYAGAVTEPVLRPDVLNILDPDAGKTKWLVENLLPADGLTLFAAAWKTAKTLLSYRLALDVVFGASVFGRFEVARPIRVAVFQFEMPKREDIRRLRRLAVGAGYDLATLDGFLRAGTLAWYSRPDLDLVRKPGGFVRTALASSPDLVIVDSLVAAFAAEENLGNPSRVRSLLTRAFAPLTSAGVAVLALHHFRKPSPIMGRDDPKGQVLGSIQFGAASDVSYGLERLKADEDAAPGSFTVLLSHLGAWTPVGISDVVVGVEDTEDDMGTIVQALAGDPARERTKDLKAFEQAALNIRRRAEDHPAGVTRKAALAGAVSDLKVSLRAAVDGLDYAEGLKWVHTRPIPGGKNNAKLILPGPEPDEPEDPE